MKILFTLLLLTLSVNAASLADLTYTTTDGKVTITDCVPGAAGELIIPTAIEDNPVTGIGSNAFQKCSSLTSVTIPSSVTSIGYAAFALCTSLTSVTIPSSVTSIAIAPFGRCTRLTSIIVEKGNVAYTSLDGVLFDIDQTKLIQYPAGKTGAYTIPDSVTSIEAAAFIECTLTSVTIPSSVTSIGNRAFNECSSLISTFFLGDAGTVSWAFSGLDQNHIFYYLDTSTGFTSPTWEGYPTQMINTATYPAAAWLLSSNHSYDTNLVQDINGDGVSLLMAYALKLNPNERLGNRLPKVVFDDANTLSMKYYGGSTGVTYRVESSKDMTAWETTDVTVSDPDSNGVLTASIPKDGACLFLRLVVVED